jgi:hypothetical protein
MADQLKDRLHTLKLGLISSYRKLSSSYSMLIFWEEYSAMWCCHASWTLAHRDYILSLLIYP